jgi:hypothetical protein
MQEPDSDQLAVRIVPLTSGCNTPSFALELTEVKPDFYQTTAAGVPFVCPPGEEGWLDGMVIEWRQETDSFCLFHPSPPHTSDCPLPKKEPDQ